MLTPDIEHHITNEKQYPYQVHFRNHQAPFPTHYLNNPAHAHPLTLNLTSTMKDSTLIKYILEISSVKYFTYKHEEV